NTTYLPNPAFNASARLKFDIYTDKALKVCLGIRETGTTAENGANGGTTGTIEFVGASSVVSGCPQATRTVNANTWTTLEFDMPNEPKASFTGNGILNPGQQALEHIALIGAGGTGAYTVHMDNFQVVTTTALPGTVTMKANSTLTYTASATDPDPGAGISYGLDADFSEAHPTAVLDPVTGAFAWTPGAGDAGITNSITVTAQDSPTNGALVKNDSKALTVVVTSDALGTQGTDGFVAGGDVSTLAWDSKPGVTYSIQTRSSSTGEWKTVQTETATDTSTSVEVTNDGTDTYFRIIEVTSSSGE
ncbi:MAG: N-acetylmuramoyl-L-alanine amidase family 2, partial [Verrucomicrobiales bacterium]|nr:N-acetylmuramoyl-L-alanine amidase family 2 [Verrucomicrobiales bacterium]